ncbi:hypothetical protein LCGC14_1224270 [marine sediment metagenome]|uniref:Uncharacterized protein n=1 Tax=marine sediment metagenome TaxID=412755 RepID=A0A0F9LXL0_9ZZZZ
MNCTQTKDSQQGTILTFEDLKDGQWFNWEDTSSPCIKIRGDLYFNVHAGYSSSNSPSCRCQVLLVDGSISWHVVK